MRQRRSKRIAWLTGIFLLLSVKRLFAGAPIQAGIGLVWGNEEEAQILAYPYVHFGQGAFVWKLIEPREGEFDWSALDATLARFHALGKKVPIQINTPCPEWIFEHVASVGTSRGGKAPQYWDPVYLGILERFIQAYAKHVGESPHKSAVLFVRMQFNALNTEILSLDSKYLNGTASADRAQWTFPANGHVYAANLNAEIQNELMQKITQFYLDAFTPRGIPVALRMDGENDLSRPGSGVDGQAIFDRWMSNPLVWTMTTHYGIGLLGSPESYRFKRRTRERGSIAFAEQFSRITSGKSSHSDADLVRNMRQVNIPDADGKIHLRELSPEQSYYWTMMMLLEWGFSYVSVYGVDHVWAYRNPAEVSVMEFVNKYAGWSRDPVRAPGAWLALGRFVSKRGTATDDNWGYFLKLEHAEDVSKAVNFVGGDTSLEGVWARQLVRPATFLLDTDLAHSLTGKSFLRIKWLNAKNADLEILIAGKRVAVLSSDGSDQWREIWTALPANAFAADALPRFVVSPAGIAPCVHLVELSRLPASAVNLN